jgi:AcrR family transcriptional regulator
MYEMSGEAKTKSEAKVEAAAKRAADMAEKAALRAGEKAERAVERAAEKAERAEGRAAERVERAEARVAEKAGQAEERAEARAARAAGARATRAAERADQSAARTADRGRDGESPGEPLIWLREEPNARRPTHSRAEIARAALEIADSEGFDAVSMRRVAQRLGAGTMTLYHYVRNKDELITLMSDSVMGEILVPAGQLSGDWRVALTQIAHRTRGAFAAHRWILDQSADGGRPGPNGIRHFEQSLAAVGSLDLSPQEIFDLIGQLDDYVFGFSLREQQELEEHLTGWPPEVRDFFQRQLDTGDFPRIRALIGDDAEAGIERILDLLADDTRFERGLKRLLDGIEANLPK